MQIANDNTTHWCAHKKNDWPATQTLTDTVVPVKFPSTVSVPSPDFSPRGLNEAALYAINVV